MTIKGTLLKSNPLFSDKPAWLDQIGQPQPTMKIPDSGMGRPCYPGFSDKCWWNEKKDEESLHLIGRN